MLEESNDARFHGMQRRMFGSDHDLANDWQGDIDSYFEYLGECFTGQQPEE